MKKLLAISIFILGNTILESCYPESGTCYELDIQTISNFTLVDYLELDEGDTLHASTYAILLDASPKNMMKCWLQPSFGGSLYADYFEQLEDQVQDISISSNGKINNDYPQGSELVGLFSPIVLSKSCLASSLEKSSCSSNYFDIYNTQSLIDAFNEGFAPTILYQNEDLLLLLAFHAPEMIDTDRHEFKLTVAYESGKKNELETRPIVFR